MGIIKPWSSNYPTSLDNTTTNFTTLVDTADDVIASHPNSLAGAVIVLEQENIGYKDNVVVTAASNEVETQLQVERVIGSILFDGGDLAHLIPHLRFIGIYNTNSGSGNARVRMYDMGAPGTPLLPPQLRSTVSIADSDDGNIIKAQQVLTLSGSPGVGLNQIHSSLRVYEFRLILDTATSGADMIVHWAGLALGVTQ